MSKKILKRSLALGALMAFVITGSAYAENMVNQTKANEINENTVDYVVDGAITAKEENIFIKGNKDATVLTVNGGDVNLAGDVGIGGYRICEGKSVDINDVKYLYVNGGYGGIIVGEDVSSYNGQVFVRETVENTVIKANTLGIFAGGGNALVQIESKDLLIEGQYGVLTNQGATINLGTEKNKVGNLSVKGTKEYAIRASGGSSINIFADYVNVEAMSSGIRPDNGHISIGSADNLVKSISVVSEKSDAIAVHSSNGSLDIYGEDVSLVTNKQDGNAIYGYANAPVTIVGEEKLDIKGNIRTDRENAIININTGVNDALVTIEGDIINNERGGSVDITLGAEGSYLKGKVTDDKSGITLTMNPGTIWEATGDSTITNVTGNGGTVKVDMKSDDSVSSVVVKGISTGISTFGATSNVTDYLAGLSGEEQENAIKEVVESVKDDSGEALTDTVVTDESMVRGAFTLKVIGDEATYDEAVNTKSDAVSDAGMTLKGHWRAHMNDMNKRMGELRNANGEHGVWTRMVRGESEYQGAKMQYNQYQMGYDEKLSVDKRWTVGAAVTFSEGDASYGFGSTEDKSTAFAIYGSKLNNDGTFVDLIARYAKLESDLDDRNYGTGDYSTNGMSVSAEFGKRIQQGNGLWIESQVEFTYGTVDSADVAFSKNFKAHYDSMDSFIARVGFAMGKDIKQGNVYARASYLYDFDGETATQFEGGKPVTEDFGGGWWEVGVGANINLSKATYIYADVEKTFGGEVDTNWQWNLGVRYSF